MIRVAHITPSLGAKAGGIPSVIRGLVQESSRSGIDCLIAAVRDREYHQGETISGVKTILGESMGPDSLGFSTNLTRYLTQEMTHDTVIHSHGLWMHPGVVARNVSRLSGVPLMITPHGMLEPWALENSKWKKRIAGWLFENKNLRSAGCIHASSTAEARNVRNYGLRNPVAVIPNGIDPAGYSHLPPYVAIEEDYPLLKGKRRVLFLARIHPKKGLPHLLKAWKGLQPNFKDWALLIAGKDELGHEAEMKILASELGLGESVFFVGPLYGTAKLKCLAGSDVFVLPSFSEGFSMAVLEAAACALPIVLTPQCNFPELIAADGAVEVQPTAESCEIGLRRVLSLSDAEREAMGSRGRGLVETHYNWRAVATKMAAVYAWLLHQGPKPATLIEN